MTPIPINPPGMGASFAPYHPFATLCPTSMLLFISGTTSRNDRNELVGLGDVAAQTRQVFSNISQVLEHAGGTLSDLVSVTVYLSDLRHFAAVAAVRRELFSHGGPSSTCVEVSGFVREGALLEISAIAAVHGDLDPPR